MTAFSYQAPPDLAHVAQEVQQTTAGDVSLGAGAPEAAVNNTNAQTQGMQLDNQLKQINLQSLNAYRTAMQNVFSPQGSQGSPSGSQGGQPAAAGNGAPAPGGTSAAPQSTAPVSDSGAQSFPVGPPGTPGRQPAPNLIETKPGEPLPPQGQQPQSAQAPAQGQPSTVAAPSAQGGTIPAGAAQSAQHASDIVEHANQFPDGTPNFLSTDNIQKVAQQWLAGGGNPNDVMKYVIDSTKTQSELKKQAADTYAATQKGGLDAVEAQGKFLDYQKNQAFSALQKMQAGDFAGAEATANQVLHQTLTTPEGLKAVQGLANSAPDNLKFQEQARKNLDTSSEVVFRNNQNRIAQQNANTQAGELAVKQGNLSREYRDQAAEMMGKAAVNDANVSRAGQLQDDLSTLKTLVDKGAISRGSNNAWVISKDQLDSGTLAALAKYPGITLASDGTLQADNLMSRIGSGITEIKLQSMAAGGSRGAAGSDKRMDLLHDSVTGNGMQVGAPTPVLLDSISYARNVANQELMRSYNMRDSYNAAVQQIPGAAGTFKPIINNYQHIAPPQVGDFVDGHVYIGGPPGQPGSWRQP